MCMRGGLFYVIRTVCLRSLAPRKPTGTSYYHKIAWSSSGIKILIWRSIDMLPVTW